MSTASGPPPQPPRPAGPSTPPPPPGPKSAVTLLTVAELAVLWRCGKDKVYRLIAAGQLGYVNIGEGRAKIRVPESAAVEFIHRGGVKRRRLRSVA